MTDGITRRKVLEVAGAGGISTAVGVGTVAGGGGESPTEYIVGLEPGQASVASARAERVTRTLDFGEIGQVVSGQFSESELSALETDDHVRYIEPNGTMEALETTPYGVELTDAAVAIEGGSTGDGVDIAIVDTGIDPKHETLEPNVGEGWAPVPCSTGDDCETTYPCNANGIDECFEAWNDDNDHGTHVAGIAAAAMNGTGLRGVAPEATLHPVKVLNCCSRGDYADIAAGIDWAADQGHDVINLSLGGDESKAVNDAIDYAVSQGAVIVAAAGNAGPCEDCVSSPAAHPDVIAVSATDQNDDLVEFSSTGTEVDIAAPGKAIPSSIARDKYAEKSGTSMAAPHVAGAAAHVIANGTTDRDAVRQTLEDTAENVGLDSNEQGSGRLDVASAVGIETPQVGVLVDPTEPSAGEPVTLDATASSTPNGEIVEYRWDFTGDSDIDRTTTDPLTTYTFDTPDTYDLTLTVVDDQGQTGSATQTITVTELEAPIAALSMTPNDPAAREPVTFDASGSVSPDGEVVEYQWDFTGDGETDRTTTTPIVTKTYTGEGSYTVSLTITDEGGQTATTEQSITTAFEVDSYAGDDGAVETDGLRTAVLDWQNSDIDSGLLTDVIDAWSNGA